MALDSERVSVTTTPTALNAEGTDRASGKSILVTNRGAASVDLGGSDVTTGAGYELRADKDISIDLDHGETLYAIAASGTVECHVLRQGV